MSAAPDDDRLYANELEGYRLPEPDRLPDHLQKWIETPAGREAYLNQQIQDDRLSSVLVGESQLSEGEVTAVLAQLAERASGEQVKPVDAEMLGVTQVSAGSHRWGRRAWAAAAAAAVVVISGTVAGWIWWRDPETASRIGIAQSSLHWGIQAEKSSWQQVTPQILQKAPIPEELDALPFRWTTIRTEWDTATVLYDLNGPEDSLAWLFVISSQHRFDVAPRFSSKPDYGTGRHAVGTMYRDRRLYVLLVEGDEAAYRQQLRRLGPIG